MDSYNEPPPMHCLVSTLTFCHSGAKNNQKPAVCFGHRYITWLTMWAFWLIWFFKYYITQESSSIYVALCYLWLFCKGIVIAFRFICELPNAIVSDLPFGLVRKGWEIRQKEFSVKTTNWTKKYCCSF